MKINIVAKTRVDHSSIIGPTTISVTIRMKTFWVVLFALLFLLLPFSRPYELSINAATRNMVMDEINLE
jgi:hypothetical protein